MKSLLFIAFFLLASCFKANRFLTPSPPVDPASLEAANALSDGIKSQEGALVASPDTAAWKIFALIVAAVFVLCFLSNPQWIKGKARALWRYASSKYKEIQKTYLTKKDK